MGWFHRSFKPLEVDIHSHLIPGIDDGAGTLAKSVEMIRAMKALGFKKLITTPHIHPKYPNTPNIILTGLEKLQEALMHANLEMEVEAAAEYFVDDLFLDRLKEGESFLYFGDRYLLIECSFVSKPIFFESIIFELQAKGYKPVLAHPERYQFLEGSIAWLCELKDAGALFQVTLGSLSGYYGAAAMKIAKKLWSENMVDLVGSDLHRMTHMEYLESSLKSKMVQKKIASGSLINHGLL
ncbi:MAG: capsular polysaccharide biosynthesis protein [Ekhidna sp.]